MRLRRSGLCSYLLRALLFFEPDALLFAPLPAADFFDPALDFDADFDADFAPDFAPDFLTPDFAAPLPARTVFLAALAAAAVVRPAARPAAAAVRRAALPADLVACETARRVWRAPLSTARAAELPPPPEPDREPSRSGLMARAAVGLTVEAALAAVSRAVLARPET